MQDSDWGEFQNLVTNSSFVKAMKKSLIPYEPHEFPRNAKHREDSNRILFDDIRSRRYMPSVPRGYIYKEKSNGIPRIIPTLRYRDNCIYYYCLRKIEVDDGFVANRQPDTFGGWVMGNRFRALEEFQLSERSPDSSDDAAPALDYSPPSAINKAKWSEEWKKYQALLSTVAREGKFQCFACLDISNFYDSISTPTLIRLLHSSLSPGMAPVINLLDVFLSNWQRDLQGYRSVQVGIPQDDVGEPSRMLANFYLHEYDKSMRAFVAGLDPPGRYFRYSDDQVIMASTHDHVMRSLVFATSCLARHGLNINATKAEVFFDWDTHEMQWGKDIFDLLEDGASQSSIQTGADHFVARYRDSKLPWRSESVLKRLVNLGLHQLTQATRDEIALIALDPSNLRHASNWWLKKLAPSLNEEQRLTLFKNLDELVEESTFTYFLYEVHAFYKGAAPSRGLGQIEARIRLMTENQRITM